MNSLKMNSLKMTAATLAVAFFAITSGVAHAVESVGIKVNGELTILNPPTFIEDYYTMVPMRFIFESIGATVEWDAPNMSATAVKNGMVFEVSIGSRTAYINGREEKMPLPAVLKSDRTFIPLRFIADSLGAKLGWDSVNSIASIDFPPEKPGIQEEAVREVALEGRSVVFIKTFDKNKKPLSTGSGFIAGSSGAIITNYHVLSSAYSAEVLLNNGKSYPVKSVLNYDANRDIAVIKIDGKNLPAVRMGSSSALSEGENVVAIGNPEGLQNIVSTGDVSTPFINLLGQNFIQFTAPIGPGSSGGPLFNMKGEVVGITTLTRKEGQNINFAVPIDEVKGLLQTAREITLGNLTEKNEKKLSYEDISSILYQYYSRFMVGEEWINFYDVWVRESMDGKTIYVGLFLDNQNYTALLKEIIYGNNRLGMENWLKVIASRVHAEYPDKKVFGVVQFQGLFHNCPRGFPADNLIQGKDNTWLINYSAIYFWYEFGDVFVEWREN